VLFFAEAVTLAHVARPIVLAQALPSQVYDVHFACDPRYAHIIGELPFPVHPIQSVSSDKFLLALSKGSPLYDTSTLRGYVQEDLKVIEETGPDVVVGDFRLSLSVSARVTRTPYITISNAYWSPYARQRFPLPEISLAKLAGVTVGTWLFRTLRPIAFAYHAMPLNRVRREFGLPSLGLDLRKTYTEADHTLYADIPEIVPTYDLPVSHRYIGPVLWSPAVSLPEWWNRLPKDKPVIYVTLGSSGQSDLLGTVLESLADLDVVVVAATAGRFNPSRVPKNAFVASYLPGCEAAARSRLVICNGGSPTTYQALVAGVPVLGICSNLDQYLNMDAVSRAGAGEVVRAGRTTARVVRNSVQSILEQIAYTEAARQLAAACSRYHAPMRFQQLLAQLGTDAGRRVAPQPGRAEL
jgi:UDP:flavonoid glycosyltransferase YjiC (YdhE family)